VHDILFIPDSTKVELGWDLDEIYMDNGVADVFFKPNSISRAAVPESILLERSLLADSLWCHFGLQELHFVSDSLEEARDGAQEVRPQLGLEVLWDAAFFRLNVRLDVDRGNLELQDGNDGRDVGVGSVYWDIRRNIYFPRFLLPMGIQSFEVRPAIVIRR
jgi:hypothetical protein